MSLPRGLFSVRPFRVVPIHLSVWTLPSGLISETYPSPSISSPRLPALGATYRSRTGSYEQLSAKWKLPKTFCIRHQIQRLTGHEGLLGFDRTRPTEPSDHDCPCDE